MHWCGAASKLIVYTLADMMQVLTVYHDYSSRHDVSANSL